MTNEDFVAYGVAAAGITAIIVQILNDLWVSSSALSPVQRAALLRGVNYLVNVGLIILAVSVRGAFATSNIFLYLAMAFGQSLGSHTGWSLISGGATSGGAGLLQRWGRTAAPAPLAAPPGTPESLANLPEIPRGS